jgi:hypothetical protein
MNKPRRTDGPNFDYLFFGLSQEWRVIDIDTYDGAEDGNNIIGCGTTPELALADWYDQQ